MKAIIFLACVAFAAALPLFGDYHHKNIWIDEYGKIWVTSQGWKVMVHRPLKHLGQLEVVVTDADGNLREVVIDHQFQIVKDNYMGQEYQSSEQYNVYPQVEFWSKYYGGFDQLEHLYNIFRQHVGPVDQQVWQQVLFKLLNEVQHGKIHYVIHEIFMNLEHGQGFYHGVESQHWPNYQLEPNQQYQTIEEHIQYGRQMYHLAQRTLALFQQYGPSHQLWGPEFNYEKQLQYVRDWEHVAQWNLEYLTKLQQNPEYVKYGMQNPWYGKNFGQNWYGKQYANQWALGQYQGPWSQYHYGIDSQYQYIQNRIHYIRWQLINFHQKSQEILHQQQLINDKIAQYQVQFQHHGDFNQQWVEEVRQLYHQLGMLVQQQLTFQFWIQQLHHDLDLQVHHWKQVMSYHHEGYVRPEKHVNGENEYYPRYKNYQHKVDVYPGQHVYGEYPQYQPYRSYQSHYHQPWYGQDSSTWGKSWWNNW